MSCRASCMACSYLLVHELHSGHIRSSWYIAFMAKVCQSLCHAHIFEVQQHMTLA